ncbi:hypothetical protein KR009_007061 [Drosophila setifemur]|nr:hypothetical protein KR009_007061 [Drosophila setifemur]
MHLKFTWLLAMVLSLLAGALASSSCPAGFDAESNRCVKDRPVHGSCPPGSTFSLNINKCVHS